MLKTLLIRFKKDESGATAIEYGLIAALISIVVIVALGAVGDQLNLVFEAIERALTDAVAKAPEPAPAE